jgi:putative transposase
MKTKRSWTAEQKLAILKEAEEQGVTATIRKHQIYGNTLYEWRQKYSTSGTDGLTTSYVRTSPDVKKLEAEIRMLKEIVAEKELTIRIKDELLKKTQVRYKSDAK